ncbi:MAG: hypothetical protein KC561_09460, partial [Myxococcales bacterium]|nr:hypothetical protein [Myxococcales bacterium]
MALVAELIACSDPPPLTSDGPEDAGATDFLGFDSGEINVGEAAPPHLLAVAASGIDRLAVYWLPQPGAEAYEVHIGNSPNFVPSAGTLAGLYPSSQNGAEIDGLSNSGTLSVRLLSIVSGARSDAQPPLAVRLLSEPTAGNAVLDLRNLGELQGTDSNAVLPNGATVVSEGDHVLFRNQSGLHFGRVSSLTTGSSGREITVGDPDYGALNANAQVHAAARLTAAPFASDAANVIESPDGEWRRWTSADGALRLETRVIEQSDADENLSGVEMSGAIGLLTEVVSELHLEGSEVARGSATINHTWSAGAGLRLEGSADLSGGALLDTNTLELTYLAGDLPIVWLIDSDLAMASAGASGEQLALQLDLNGSAHHTLAIDYQEEGLQLGSEGDVEWAATPTVDGLDFLDNGLVFSTQTAIDVGNTRVQSVAEIFARTQLVTNDAPSCRTERALDALDVSIGDRFSASWSGDPLLTAEEEEDAALVFALPEPSLVGPETAFRPDGATIGMQGVVGVNSELDRPSAIWTTTPEVLVFADMGTAVVVPNSQSESPETFEVDAVVLVQNLGETAWMCAQPTSFISFNRPATCQETSVFVVAGPPNSFSVPCDDPDGDHPVSVDIVSFPSVGTLTDPGVSCDDQHCVFEATFESAPSVDLLDDRFELQATDIYGATGGIEGPTGDVLLIYNRRPTATAPDVIVDLSSETTTVRDIPITVDDPEVPSDPLPASVSLTIIESPEFGSLELSAPATVRLTLPRFTEANYGAPLPSSNLFDTFTVVPVDAHGTPGDDLVVTVVLRPPLCDAIDTFAPEGLDDRFDYCVTELCDGNDCRVECVPRVALDNALGYNQARYPSSSTCADKAESFGSNWGSAENPVHSTIIQAECPCANGRAYADDT